MVNTGNMTVREAIIALVAMSDLDTGFSVSILNSDPVPIVAINENEDGQVVGMDERSAQKEEEDDGYDAEAQI